MRRRLELLLAAMYGRSIPIAVAEHDERGWLARMRRRFDDREVLAASDGQALRLPASIDAMQGEDVAMARLRLLAMEQAERVVRGTAVVAASAEDPLERDLFLLRESVAVDASIARTTRGVAPSLAAARAEALARRPLLEALTSSERRLEALVRQVLAADPMVPPASLGAEGTPLDSLGWARETAAQLRSDDGYRGVPAVALWGQVLPPEGAGSSAGPDHFALRVGPQIELETTAGDKSRASDTGNEQRKQNRQPAASPRAEQDRGQRRVTHEGGGAPAMGIDDPVGTGPSAAPDDEDPEAPRREDAVYDEWSHSEKQYRRGKVIVRCRVAMEADPAWATRELREHAALVRRVRERFDRLRARRSRLLRQRDGDELDLAACVRALVDARTGHAIDDRLYIDVRPARRELAILLLVDVSGSTDAFVTPSAQVIDIEKTALLLAGEALEALGDRYAILTFSGRGARRVHLTTIKEFSERNGPATRGRISALEPTGNTRLGAAIRHATSLLDAQPAGHRLLLILSDGEPNDIGGYQGQYGVEDSRQAVLEARARDVYPFCLTVHREESTYLRRIFGRSGYSILRQPDQLPMALLRAVSALLES